RHVVCLVLGAHSIESVLYPVSNDLLPRRRLLPSRRNSNGNGLKILSGRTCGRKRGCTANWVRGIMRSAEPQTVDSVFREHGQGFQTLNPERYLPMAVIRTKVRSGDD